MAATEEIEKEILAEMAANPVPYAAGQVNDVITIDGETRMISVPASEIFFGVESDKDVERKHFRCPKVVGDGIDLSKHQIYISYITSDSAGKTFSGNAGLYLCEDVATDGDDITFSWQLSGNVFASAGFIAFKVLAAKTDGENVQTRWNTVPAIGTVLMTVPDGMDIGEAYPDIVTQLLERMASVEKIATEEAMQGYVNTYLEAHPGEIDETLTDPKKAAPASVVGELKGDIAELNHELLNHKYEYDIYVKVQGMKFEQDEYDKTIYKSIRDSSYTAMFVPLEEDIYLTGNFNYLIFNPNYFISSYQEVSIRADVEKVNGIRKVEKNSRNYAWLWFKNENIIKIYVDDNKKLLIRNIEWKPGLILQDGSTAVLGDYDGKFTILPFKKGTRILCEIPEDCFLRLYCNGKRRNVYDMPKFEFVLPSDSTPINVLKKDRTVVENVNDICSFYIINRTPSEYDVIVAASNSTDDEKKIADYICDGIRDEVEINCAINSNISCGSNAKVLLLSGDYHVGFTEYTPWEQDESVDKYEEGFGSIITRDSWTDDRRNNVYLYGKYHATDSSYGKSKIIVDSETVNNMDSDKEYHVLTAMRKGTNPYGYVYGLIKNNYKNLYVYIDGHNKNVIAFDGTANNAFTLEYCRVATDIGFGNKNFANLTIAPKLTGIRGDTGEDSGASQYIRHCVVSGLYDGLNITGEHYVIEQVSSLINMVGLRTLGTRVYGMSGHTTMFKNITIERCDRVIYLDDPYINNEQVWEPSGCTIWIDGCSTEQEWVVDGVTCKMKPIFEKLKNSYVGEINMEWELNELMYDTDSTVGYSCGQIKLKKSRFPRRIQGAIGSRKIPDATKQQDGTEIFDPLNKCMLYATSDGWVKHDGTIVDE